MANDREQELKRLDEELFTEEMIAEEPPIEPVAPEKKKEDKLVIALMLIASGLTMGIIGVLVYWLEVFLK